MKNYLVSILFLLLVISCKQQKEKPERASQTQTAISTFEYAHEFIGDQKATAMILGVFHFSSSNLDGYKEKFNIDIFSKVFKKENLILMIRITRSIKLVFDLQKN